MRIIDMLNKGLGTIAGAFIGFYIPFAQIAFAYVLFWQSMRRAKYNWFTTLLGTLTIGSVAALITAFTALLFFPIAPIYGMMVGFREGLFHKTRDGFTGVFPMIFNIIERFDKKIVFLFTDPGVYTWKSDRHVMTWIRQYLTLGAFSFAEVFQTMRPLRGVKHHVLENTKYYLYERREAILRNPNYGRALRLIDRNANGPNAYNDTVDDGQHAAGFIIEAANIILNREQEQPNLLQQRTREENTIVQACRLLQRQEPRNPLFNALLQGERPPNNPDPIEIKARNATLLSSFLPPEEVKSIRVNMLTELEIEEVRLKIEAIENKDERTERNKQLQDYLAAVQCPITCVSIVNPVTVEEGAGWRVYENSALRDSIERDNKNSTDARDPVSRTELRKLTITNGRPKFMSMVISDFVTYARQEKRINARLKKISELKIFDRTSNNATTPSAPVSKPDEKKSAVSKLKPRGGTGQ